MTVPVTDDQAIALIVLCGTSFSGKSTFASVLERELRATVISLDAINLRRGLRSGDGVAVVDWVRTHQIARAEVTAALQQRRSVVIDDTSSPRFLREGWRVLAQKVETRCVLIYLEVERDTVLRRREANNADSSRAGVRDEVLFDHLDHFEPPAPDERTLTIHPGDDAVAWVGVHLAPLRRS